MATDLTCGDTGSTAQEIVQRINEHDAELIQAIADILANTNNITTNANNIATLNNNKLSIDGSIAMTGALEMGSNPVNGINQLTAMVKFNGESAVGTDCTILSSHNINRVEHVSGGVYKAYFTTDMQNNNYVLGGSTSSSTGSSPLQVGLPSNGSEQTTISYVLFNTFATDNDPYDGLNVGIFVFGGKN